MKKVWKWVIGIIVAVLVVGAIVAVPYAMHSFFAPTFATRTYGGDGSFGPGMMRQLQMEGAGPGFVHPGGRMGRGQSGYFGPDAYPHGAMMNQFGSDGYNCAGYAQGGYYHGGMMGRSFSFNQPMMYGFGFSPFSLVRWIIPLVVLGFAIYGVVALFNRRKTSPVPAEAVPTQSCGNCGKPTSGDWKNCPYCGNAL